MASVLVMEETFERGNRSYLLIRYAADGAFAGDTWHLTVDEALEQASYEFGGALGRWIDVPPDVDDARAFILRRMHEECSWPNASSGPPTMSRTRWKLAALAGLVGAVMIFILSRPPVLFAFTLPGEVVRPSVTIFNPLRDRAPEQIAERMLTELRRGDVDSAMARVYNGATHEIAEKERRYHLRRWKLVNRVDGPNNVTLYYRVDRGASGFFDSDITLFLCCRQRGWLISYYLPMY